MTMTTVHLKIIR